MLVEEADMLLCYCHGHWNYHYNDNDNNNDNVVCNDNCDCLSFYLNN